MQPVARGLLGIHPRWDSPFTASSGRGQRAGAFRHLNYNMNLVVGKPHPGTNSFFGLPLGNNRYPCPSHLVRNRIKRGTCRHPDHKKTILNAIEDRLCRCADRRATLAAVSRNRPRRDVLPGVREPDRQPWRFPPGAANRAPRQGRGGPQRAMRMSTSRSAVAGAADRRRGRRVRHRLRFFSGGTVR